MKNIFFFHVGEYEKKILLGIERSQINRNGEVGILEATAIKKKVFFSRIVHLNNTLAMK